MSPIRIKTKPFTPNDPGLSTTQRQELIPDFDQSKLRAASADLIGAGGIGSELGEGLCRKGIGELRVFDHDVVEHSNLNRQTFFIQDIGQNKAERLVRNLAPHCMNGTTLIEGYPLSFQDALALKITVRPTFAVCGVDNRETRVAVAEHYRQLAIPVVFLSVDFLAECGQVFVQESLPGAPCFGCAFPNSLTPKKMPCFTPASKDVLKLTAGLALYAIDSLIMNRKRNWNYRLIHLAGFAPDLKLTLERRRDCPLCFSSIQQGSSGVATTAPEPLRGVTPLSPLDDSKKHH